MDPSLRLGEHGEAKALVAGGVRPFELPREKPEGGSRLLEGHARLEASHREVASGLAAAQGLAFPERGQPDVGEQAQVDPVEALGSHADDLVGACIQEQGLPEHVSASPEATLPQAVADHDIASPPCAPSSSSEKKRP